MSTDVLDAKIEPEPVWCRASPSGKHAKPTADFPADLARPRVIGQHGLPATVHEQVNVAGHVRGEGLLTHALPAPRGQKQRASVGRLPGLLGPA